MTGKRQKQEETRTDYNYTVTISSGLIIGISMMSRMLDIMIGSTGETHVTDSQQMSLLCYAGYVFGGTLLYPGETVGARAALLLIVS